MLEAVEMPGKTRLFYWDTCVFLAWIKDEKRPPGEMDNLRGCVELVEANQAHVITSALTFAEITRSRCSDKAIEMFEGILRRQNATVVNVDVKVARLASDIRGYYLDRKDEHGLGLCTPDAIHLATALLYKADEFHTFDERNGRGSLGLLGLDGNIAGRPLRVLKPLASNQPSLDL